MINKRHVLLFQIFLIFVFSNLLLFQLAIGNCTSDKSDPDNAMMGWSEKQVLDYINKTLSSKDTAVEFWGSEMYHFAEVAASLKSEKIAGKLLGIPEYDIEITKAKLTAFRLIDWNPKIRDYVISYLDSKSSAIQIIAASTLLCWGDWDLGAPIICKCEAYSEFQSYKDNRAVPLLQDAISNGSWKGGLLAARALYRTYGDSAVYPKVIFDILQNAPLQTDDENITWAKYIALRESIRLKSKQLLPGLVRLADDNNRAIRLMVVKQLLNFGELGDSEATKTLVKMGNNDPDLDIRQKAKQALIAIGAKQK